MIWFGGYVILGVLVGCALVWRYWDDNDEIHDDLIGISAIAGVLWPMVVLIGLGWYVVKRFVPKAKM